MIYSPFEQFELNVYFFSFLNIKSLSIDFSITNSFLTLLFVLLLLVLLLIFTNYNTKFFTNGLNLVFELIYKFILLLLKEQTGIKGLKYFPLIFNVFMLILLMNLLGLFPYNFTISAQIAVTFTLALSFFIGFILIGFNQQGVSFLKIFVPSGIPNWLLPLLVLIEIMSFFLRPLSLSIRLFANMLAGHVLLHIIAGAVIVALAFNLFISFIPWLFIIVFLILELGIAFLQAYVFSILLCIYLHDSIYGH
jgi:F-type H+-transporting ATPase subunit a